MRFEIATSGGWLRLALLAMTTRRSGWPLRRRSIWDYSLVIFKVSGRLHRQPTSWEILAMTLNSNRGFDVGVGLIVEQGEVFVLEIENRHHRRVQLQARQGERLGGEAAP